MFSEAIRMTPDSRRSRKLFGSSTLGGSGRQRLMATPISSNPVSGYFQICSSSIRWNHIFADIWGVFTDTWYGGTDSPP